MKKTIEFAMVAVSMLFSSDAAKAVNYKFSGVVHSVDEPISSQFHVGDIVSGHMSLTFVEASSKVGFYDVSNFAADIGGHYAIASPGNADFAILNNFFTFTDLVQLNIYSPLAPMVMGHTPDSFTFHLRYDVNALSSTDLLPQFIFASPVDLSGLRFDVDDSIEVHFMLTDFSVVPEPSTLLLVLMCSGLLLVKWRGRASIALCQ